MQDLTVAEITNLLDNSADAETIALEIVSCDPLHGELSCARNVFSEIWVEEDANETLATIVRELWDIAYNYGYHDGKAEVEEEIV